MASPEMQVSPLRRRYASTPVEMTTIVVSGSGSGLFFELRGEVFPLGGAGGTLLAEGFELGGEGACGFGGGKDGLLLLGLRDARIEIGELVLDGGDAVFHLLQLDGIQALGGVLGC